MPITPNKGTQQYELLKELKTHKVTSMDAFTKLGITSFHRRMTDLKELGWVISNSWEENRETGKRYKVYRIVRTRRWAR